MAVARTRAIALIGLSGSIVEIEADVSNQLPGFALIGLPDAALGEARERVRAASANSGTPLPPRKLTVNLSPAALPKHGSGFDLGVALACLAASGVVTVESIERVVHLGELGLDGKLRPILGILPAVLTAVRAGFNRVMVPKANSAEAALVDGAQVIGVGSLAEALAWHGADVSFVASDDDFEAKDDCLKDAEITNQGDLADVIGNRETVEALIAAAAGGHHLAMFGPPGAGKTMLASRLPGLLPDLDTGKALEVASLRSLAGSPVSAISYRPPFERPHHTATAAAIIGGGSRMVRPGAASRASHGVLFLDEAPEFPRTVLDVLRQPLESGAIEIHRASVVATFPAQFQLVLAANPCPCGGWADTGELCDCSRLSRRRYLARLSGPLRDRVDIECWVPRITSAGLRAAADIPGITTAEASTRVVSARAAAAERYRKTSWKTNAQVPGPWLRGAGGMHPGRKATVSIDRALEQGSITMRGYDRTIKVAWTFCDLDGSATPTADHIQRAFAFRRAKYT